MARPRILGHLRHFVPVQPEDGFGCGVVDLKLLRRLRYIQFEIEKVPDIFKPTYLIVQDFITTFWMNCLRTRLDTLEYLHLPFLFLMKSNLFIIQVEFI